MNAVELAQRAYGFAAAPVRTNRGTEYDAIARVTQSLKVAEVPLTGNFASLAQAIHENRKLWTTLGADVADRGNSLPEMVRARVFYLSRFVDQHSRKVLKGEATVEILVEINTSIMRGLAPEGAVE
ncbi:flagellar protein FlaF [Aliiruegeria haliotis]|uniref:Flagellar protein FlaF n=1 Tax=Aliiruegeria haliotis TaxID=1280846 RepID=A0A2T0RE34_9RHOB|nr:flagellar biosynthesis regulator FlaF [Aliiruegeria haliotis]PRY19456.1 flagellar protein FlaF [Aliiruegeria haliotis]